MHVSWTLLFRNLNFIPSFFPISSSPSTSSDWNPPSLYAVDVCSFDPSFSSKPPSSFSPAGTCTASESSLGGEMKLKTRRQPGQPKAAAVTHTHTLPAVSPNPLPHSTRQGRCVSEGLPVALVDWNGSEKQPSSKYLQSWDTTPKRFLQRGG